MKHLIQLSKEMLIAVLNDEKTQMRIPVDENVFYENDIMVFYNKSVSVSVQIIKVRRSNLQDLTELDAIEEGVKKVGKLYKDYIDSQRFNSEYGCLRPVLSFRSFWQAKYGENSWGLNPQVWVIYFVKCT